MREKITIKKKILINHILTTKKIINLGVMCLSHRREFTGLYFILFNMTKKCKSRSIIFLFNLIFFYFRIISWD
jgi:hypothetical protein